MFASTSDAPEPSVQAVFASDEAGEAAPVRSPKPRTRKSLPDQIDFGF